MVERTNIDTFFFVMVSEVKQHSQMAKSTMRNEIFYTISICKKKKNQFTYGFTRKIFAAEKTYLGMNEQSLCAWTLLFFFLASDDFQLFCSLFTTKFYWCPLLLRYCSTIFTETLALFIRHGPYFNYFSFTIFFFSLCPPDCIIRIFIYRLT